MERRDAMERMGLGGKGMGWRDGDGTENGMGRIRGWSGEKWMRWKEWDWVT